VHDELELLDRERGDVNLIALFQQPLLGIHHFQRLRGVTSENEDLRDNGPPVEMARPRRAPGRRGTGAAS
jgi:hypothetical protein